MMAETFFNKREKMGDIHTLEFGGIGEAYQPLMCEISTEEGGIVLYSLMGEPLYKAAQPKLTVSVPGTVEAIIEMMEVPPTAPPTWWQRHGKKVVVGTIIIGAGVGIGVGASILLKKKRSG